MKHVRSLLWALSLVLSFPTITLAQQSVSPCTRVSGGSTSGSCVPVTASAPLPVTGTVTSNSSAKATAAAPSYTEGTSDPLSQTLSGDLRTTNLSIGANSSAAKTSSTLMGVSDGTNQQQLIAPIALTDGVNGNNSLAAGVYVWNGTSWDRLRQIPLGITPTDRTITSASGSSQQLMAANASRHSLTIVNTGNANCGVNPTGGTAAIGGAGTLTLVPNGAYTPRVPTLSAVTVICTAAQPIYANEN